MFPQSILPASTHHYQRHSFLGITHCPAHSRGSLITCPVNSHVPLGLGGSRTPGDGLEEPWMEPRQSGARISAPRRAPPGRPRGLQRWAQAQGSAPGWDPAPPTPAAWLGIEVARYQGVRAMNSSAAGSLYWCDLEIHPESGRVCPASALDLLAASSLVWTLQSLLPDLPASTCARSGLLSALSRKGL